MTWNVICNAMDGVFGARKTNIILLQRE